MFGAFGLLVGLLHVSWAADPATLDSWLDFPHRHSLVVTEGGRGVAWVECSREQGCNVHRGSGNSPTTQVTSFAPDDGLFEIAGLRALPEGLVFARRPVDGANPTGMRVPPSGSVWTYLTGTVKEQLPGISSFLHADALGIYVFNGRQLTRHSFDGTQTLLLELQADQGVIASVRSRDGGDIVFVNDRGDRELVGTSRLVSLQTVHVGCWRF
jgi:hypothetical protein